MRLWIKYQFQELMNLNLCSAIELNNEKINFYFGDFYLTWTFSSKEKCLQVYTFIHCNILKRLDDINQNGDNLVDISQDLGDN